MFNINKNWIALLVLVIVVAGILFLPRNSVVPIIENETSKTPEPNPINITSEDISQIHGTMDSNSLDLLKQVIKNNQDNYTRERAIFTFTDISIHANKSSEALLFLKEIALTEQNSSVKSAAFANYYFIKDQNPVQNAYLNVSINGVQEIGNNITIVLTGGSTIDNHAEFVVKKIESFGVDEDHIVYEDEPYTQSVLGKIILLTNNPQSFDSIANTPYTKSFVFLLNGTGEYIITVGAIYKYDLLDYEEIDKKIGVRVQ
ncbi:Uncharacterised protein [Candidatus Bilamarchaeum dharawalense]|uniref:Uncharacterized protein n=1 Tax=Candidatus Bilamarchaeum dharawalense TaxID=2885759 RepID=A0A5E4LRQ3_9ARCH|nr:Uncharacterised protein [Candidatus Bilamarchaeum dharawalense]